MWSVFHPNTLPLDQTSSLQKQRRSDNTANTISDQPITCVNAHVPHKITPRIEAGFEWAKGNNPTESSSVNFAGVIFPAEFLSSANKFIIFRNGMSKVCCFQSFLPV